MILVGIVADSGEASPVAHRGPVLAVVVGDVAHFPAIRRNVHPWHDLAPAKRFLVVDPERPADVDTVVPRMLVVDVPMTARGDQTEAERNEAHGLDAHRTFGVGRMVPPRAAAEPVGSVHDLDGRRRGPPLTTARGPDPSAAPRPPPTGAPAS